ncbi:single-stranded DNA-binding protein [Blastococcus sp. Marseille-P5729]|uniref:single-stranded DNA-binding protein n=1 Tax=Blastococcus sp. Marseille-P5729 TaxID=2086582 RepID=UPI000D0FBE22|nr:single-stranded DNA-binding protein [Blastococcus sp. Marseille-P5729]
MSARVGSTRNHVYLCGRLSAQADIRQLPSGDEVAVWRLVVPRDDGSRAAVDTIDCEGYTRQVRRLAARWPAGVVLEVEGALRRRFWQSPAGARSRYVVDVRAVRRARAAKDADEANTAERAP